MWRLLISGVVCPWSGPPRSASRSSHQPEIVQIPFRRRSVIDVDIVARPQACRLGITVSVLGVAIGLLSCITILRRLRVPTTVGRSRGRQGVHSGAQGAVGDHMPKIKATLITAVVVLVAVLVLTKAGRDIDAATQRFMLYYAGVLALVGLTGSVLLGLVATDRIVMTPGHRVMAQAVHRAFSFGTLAFLIIHITTEILAQRSHVLPIFVPFLSPDRTFYIGLGTIASDLILLLVITSILRKRFTAHGKAWRWRAMHYSSYVAFVFGVLHGLLGGRAAKPYVDWSYGFAIAVTALGLAVRFLAVSLRPKESLSTSPSVDRAGPGSASPMRAAALAMAQAQLSGAQFGSTVQVLPAALGAGGVADTGSWTATALPMQGRSQASGPLAAIGPAPDYGADYGAVPDYGTASDYGAAPAYVGAPPVMDAYGAFPDPYSPAPDPDRKSTRLNSSHPSISYAVFCL